MASDADDADLDDEEYEIDTIDDSRFRKTANRRILEFLIHWKGYPSSEDSWTPASQFDADDPPVLAFYAEHPTKPRIDVPTPSSPLRERVVSVNDRPSQSKAKPATQSRDIGSFFKPRAGGKENTSPRTSAKGSKPGTSSNSRAKPRRSKAKDEDSGSDFVLEHKTKGSDDDLGSAKSTSDASEALESDDAAEEGAYIRSYPLTSAPKPTKKNPGWNGGKGKATKKAPIQL